jgi:hypothetical protein
MLLLPLGFLWVEFIENIDHSEWNLLKSWAEKNGIHTATFYMLLFSSGNCQMEPTEEMGHPEWNLLKAGLPWMD